MAVPLRHCKANNPDYGLVKVGPSHGVIWITVAIKIHHSRQSSPLGLMQIVYFHQGNSGGGIYTAHDGGVVTRWQVPNDRRFPRIPRSPTAIDDILHLVLSDNPADDRSLPVIIRSNQISGAIVQFQCGILQRVGNAKLTELRANGAYDHSLCSRTLDNETTNHHVVPSLHKSASADVPENYTGTGGKIVHFHKRDSGRAIYTAHDGSVVTRWQVSNDRRFPRVPRSPTAIDDILHLVLSDNPADDRRLPVVIRTNQISGAIVQFQCGILQWIGNAKLTELRANSAYDHSLCSRALDNKPTNHHVVPGLNKAASADIAEDCPRCRTR